MMGSLDHNRFTVGLTLLLMVTGMLTFFICPGYMASGGMPRAPFYSLAIFSIVGGVVMIQAADLLTLFLGLETLSLCAYLMVGLQSQDIRSPEASMKYFIIGSFASGVFLYGIVMMYAATGSISLAAEFKSSTPGIELLGIGLILSGFMFKIGAVPFHMWVPDVYEGAPTPVTAFLASGVKVAIYAGLVKFLYFGAFERALYWVPFLGMVAAVTMVFGNLAALAQVSLKRLLAYSSITHSGYLLLAVLSVHVSGEGPFGLSQAELVRVVSSGDLNTVSNFYGTQALIFYLISYSFTTIGAFVCMSWIGRDGEHLEYIDEFRGLAYRHPTAAAMMSLFMLSLAGMPPTAGFAAKYFVFASAVQAGYLPLAVIGLLSSLVSFYYYLKIIIQMYMAAPDREFEITQVMPAHLTLIACALAVLYLGCFPAFGLDLAHSAALHLARSIAGL